MQSEYRNCVCMHRVPFAYSEKRYEAVYILSEEKRSQPGSEWVTVGSRGASTSDNEEIPSLLVIRKTFRNSLQSVIIVTTN